jgi:hypothetical protein
MIDYSVESVVLLSSVVGLQNLIKKIKDYANPRGMSWSIDIKHWVGGYLYEFACVDKVFNIVRKRGFHLENPRCNNGLRNNEYLFSKA